MYTHQVTRGGGAAVVASAAHYTVMPALIIKWRQQFQDICPKSLLPAEAGVLEAIANVRTLSASTKWNFNVTLLRLIAPLYLRPTCMSMCLLAKSALFRLVPRKRGLAGEI
jgi:hypothetical protein